MHIHMESPPSAPPPEASNGLTALLKMPVHVRLDVHVPAWSLAAAGGGILLLLVLLICCCKIRRRRKWWHHQARDSPPSNRKKVPKQFQVLPQPPKPVMDPSLVEAGKMSAGELVHVVAQERLMGELKVKVDGGTEAMGRMQETVTNSVDHTTAQLAALETRQEGLVREMCTAIATVTGEAVERGLASLEKRQVAVLDELESRQEARMLEANARSETRILEVEKRVSDKQQARQQLATMAMAEQMEYLASVAESLSDIHRGAAEGRRQAAERRKIRASAALESTAGIAPVSATDHGDGGEATRAAPAIDPDGGGAAASPPPDTTLTN